MKAKYFIPNFIAGLLFAAAGYLFICSMYWTFDPKRWLWPGYVWMGIIIVICIIIGIREARKQRIFDENFGDLFDKNGR